MAQGPHESPKLLLVPICILAVFAFTAGWTNPAMLDEEFHNFTQYVEPFVAHHEEAEAAAEGRFVHVYVDNTDPARTVTPMPDVIRAAVEPLLRPR